MTEFGNLSTATTKKIDLEKMWKKLLQNPTEQKNAKNPRKILQNFFCRIIFA
jgi:hypothetical protein